MMLVGGFSHRRLDGVRLHVRRHAHSPATRGYHRSSGDPDKPTSANQAGHGGDYAYEQQRWRTRDGTFAGYWYLALSTVPVALQVRKVDTCVQHTSRRTFRILTRLTFRSLPSNLQPATATRQSQELSQQPASLLPVHTSTNPWNGAEPHIQHQPTTVGCSPDHVR